MPCPICNVPDTGPTQALPDADQASEKFLVRECSACGSARLDPLPDHAVLSRYYHQDYYGTGGTKFSPVLDGLLDRGIRQRAAWLMRGLNANTAPLVLDIGCGRGALLRELAALGARGIGLERTPLAGMFSSSAVQIRIGELDQQGFANGSLDAMVLWHVAEHLADPLASVRAAERLLKPGGLLCLAVPNHASWQRRRFGQHWFHYDIPRHLHFLAHQALSDYLRVHDWTLIESHHCDLAQSVFAFAQSTLNLLPGAPPNRLYQLMRGATGWKKLELLAWAIPFALLLPLALAEYLWHRHGGNGATSILLARRPEASV